MTVDLLRCALPGLSTDRLALDRATRPFITTAAAEALAAARAAPHRAGGTLSRWFRQARRLGSRDRRLVSAMVYDVIRHEGILTRAGASDDAARLARWPELVCGDQLLQLPPTCPADDYAAALSLPPPIASEWLSRHGPAGAAALGGALAGRAPTTIRANRIRCTREQLAARLAEEGIETRPAALAPNGLYVDTRTNFPTLTSFREGWFEVQDEASQLFCAAVDVVPGQTVLDLCAGAGGKSLALAAAGARVQAHDIRTSALRELQRRAARAGARVQSGAPRQADIVVVDAPCSGTGRLRRDPALRLGLPSMDLAGLRQTQQALIAQGASLVRPGGRLFYATCSLLQEEHHHTLSGWTRTDERVCWPHAGGTDGFSWCAWRRSQLPNSGDGVRG